MELILVEVTKGNAVLAKSVTPSRIEENLKIIDLTPDDIKELDEIHKKGITRFVFPAFGKPPKVKVSVSVI